MAEPIIKTLAFSCLIWACAILASPLTANATSDGVCYQVRNVENWDKLNIRIARAASSQIVGSIPPVQHGIIAREGACEPSTVPVKSRWCQIAYYDGNVTIRGYVKRRFLEQSECP